MDVYQQFKIEIETKSKNKNLKISTQAHRGEKHLTQVGYFTHLIAR